MLEFLPNFNLASITWNWAFFMLDLTLKGSLILAASFLTSKIMAKASFQLHHLIIFLGLSSLAALPAIYLLGSHVFSSHSFLGSSYLGDFTKNPAFFIPGLSGTLVHNWSWLVISLMTVWFLGFSSQFLKVMISVLKMRQVIQQARKMENPSWNRRLISICPGKKLRRRIKLRRSNQYPVPITCGFFHGIIILPQEAENWSGDQQQVVLLHEISHIRRFDNLLQLIARTIASIFWFNPLVGSAVRLLHHFREGACDDYVLSAGYKPSVYAGHLLDIIQSSRRRRSITSLDFRNPNGAVPGAAKERLLNILDTSRMRRILSPRGVTISIIIGFLFIMPLSTFNPVAATEKILPGSQNVFRQPGPNIIKQVQATPSPTELTKSPDPRKVLAKKE
jgi:beta-lactamase regulating signal transducer with metallopeptidase domain